MHVRVCICTALRSANSLLGCEAAFPYSRPSSRIEVALIVRRGTIVASLVLRGVCLRSFALAMEVMRSLKVKRNGERKASCWISWKME